ncbi:transcription factor jumonji [Fusarium subglutinans]|uniref:Transcription factor jumonji n=1 Tax=Gibberella subglutinans TaxID=42677 RepID=A0A8H5Q0C2_GIBSU|nr:transcription factor jumonji [Fusarium subglutinans]KAF5606327.1 transcription factor jumonji [Fusarium subglutinans]
MTPRFAPPSSKRTSADSVEARPSHKRRAERSDITTAAQMDEEITNQKTTNAPAKACGWCVFQCLERVWPALDTRQKVFIMAAPTQYLSPNFNGADPIPAIHMSSLRVSSYIVEALRLVKKDTGTRMEQGNRLKPGERFEITTAEIDEFVGKKPTESGPGRWPLNTVPFAKHPVMQPELGKQARETSPLICPPEAKDNSPEFDQSQRSKPRSAPFCYHMENEGPTGYTTSKAKNYADDAWTTSTCQTCETKCQLATAIPVKRNGLGA